MKKLTTIQIALIMAALLLSVAIIGFLLGRGTHGPDESALPAEQQEDASEGQTQELTLYFAAPDGMSLVPEIREVPECEEEKECLRATVEALIAGPEGDLSRVLPAKSRLLDLSVEEGVAVLNFHRSVVDLHPGGSASELATVYALVDTLAVNFPHIRKMRLLIEGEQVESLKGHVDLRAPVLADFKYTRSPEGAETPQDAGMEETGE